MSSDRNCSKQTADVMCWGCDSCVGEGRIIPYLLGKHEGKRPLVRSMCRQDNIKVHRKETGWEGID
jgi:hypothetical protein